MKPTIIRSFSGDYRFLSNFWRVPIQYEGVSYKSVEHAYQAAKATNPEDKERIRNTSTPSDARTLGRSIKIRSDWDDVRLHIMRTLLLIKFSYSDYRKQLIKTKGAYLVEGNTWHDNFFGICSCAKCRAKGVGANNLGLLLMDIRKEALRRQAYKKRIKKMVKAALLLCQETA